MPMTLDDWLDACADAPEDDFTHQAFADWLEETGDLDRATFIRLRVALSRHPEEQQDRAQVATADALLAKHRLAWLGPLAAVADHPEAWQFPRGLPGALVLESKGVGPAIVSRLVWSPHLDRLTELQLGGNQLGDTGAQALAASPRLARLTLLCLSGNAIGDAGAQALATSPHLARLTRLVLWNNQIGDVAKAALLQRFGERVSL